MVLSVSLLACKKHLQSQATIINEPNKQEKVIDSLLVDINKDGQPDKVIISEKTPTANRTITVQLNNQNTYKTISSNNKIIACSTCGVQSGDPYVSLKATDTGFDLIQEDIVYSFSFKSNEVFLEKIDLLKTKQTSEGIDEQHEIYTSKDFGIINLNNFDDDIILKLRSHSSGQIINSIVQYNVIIKNGPTEINLPFSFHQYFKDEYSESKYPSYDVNSSLTDYLKTKSYDGESYKAFVLRSDDQFQYLVVDMSRGGSDYFILITTQNNNIIDYKEIGSIGDENPVTFKIFPDFTVEKYKGNTEDATAFEKFKIDQKGKIIKL